MHINKAIKVWIWIPQGQWSFYQLCALLNTREMLQGKQVCRYCHYCSHCQSSAAKSFRVCFCAFCVEHQPHSTSELKWHCPLQNGQQKGHGCWLPQPAPASNVSPKQEVSRARKVWGTLRPASHFTIRNTISQLTNLPWVSEPSSLHVTCKMRGHARKVKWWFILHSETIRSLQPCQAWQWKSRCHCQTYFTTYHAGYSCSV